MPLAFTQEDFLVSVFLTTCYHLRFFFFCFWHLCHNFHIQVITATNGQSIKLFINVPAAEVNDHFYHIYFLHVYIVKYI